MRDRGIDGIRGLAILGVILYHASHSSGAGSAWHWWSLGALGVPVFFVVSGYLLSLPWAHYALGLAPAPSLRRYLVRRLLRLEPPWVICLAVSWLAMNPWDQRWIGEHVLPTLFYSHDALIAGASPITPQSWSLEVEVRWYLLAPFATQLFWLPRWLRRSLLIAYAACAHGWGGHFALGMLVADVRSSGDMIVPGIASSLALLAIPLGGFGGLSLTPWLAALAIMNPPRLGVVIERMGEWCYSLYLYHRLGQVFPSGSPWVGLAENTMAGIATGLAAYFMVEAPARRRWRV